MKDKSFADYMDSVYEVLDEPMNDTDDGVVYLDEEIIEDDDNGWGDDITYIGDEEEEEQGYIEDLGEGYIPLPVGDEVQYETVVIDENYVLDEYETDIDSSVSYVDESDSYQETKSIIMSKDGDIDENLYLDPEEAISVIQLPKTETLSEELNTNISDNPIDDKISKAIAREYMVEAEASVDLLPGDVIEEDASWVDNEDLFGNNIDLILAEDPSEEIEDTDYVEGSFEDWILDNGISM